MSTQHTPGPWRFVDSCPDGHVIRSGNPHVPAGHGPAVAVVEDKGFGDKAVQMETLANARLIAAAPELLEALETILAESDHDGYGARTDAQIPRLRAALGKARAAIAKAKGSAT